MATVTITIHDLEDGKVAVEARPNFAEMMGLMDNGSGLSSGQAYALCALNAIRRESKSRDPHRILIPRISA